MSSISFIQPAATYEDLEALPEHLRGEILEGVLYASPRPAGPHLLTSSALGILVGGPFHLGQGGPGGWWILHEPELRFGRNTCVPDLAGWRREKMPQIPQNHIFDISPDWVCEIVSPGSKRQDRKLKPPIYKKALVNYLWIIDPLARSLEILKREEKGWLMNGFYSDDDLVKAPPFDSIELDLLLLWGETRTPEKSEEG